MPDPLLELDAVRCERDDRVLFEALDLRLDAGEALQLRGANGAGKTTLLRCIAGLHPDYTGAIRIEGRAVRDAGARIAFVGHRPGVSAPLTAAENLRWHQHVAGLPVDDALVDAALVRVGLPGFDAVPCTQMSAGQQRRVALARLLLPGARVPLWLLDEPFTALDDAGVVLVVDLLRAHLGDGGAVILATHQDVDGLPGLRTLRIDGGRATLEAA